MVKSKPSATASAPVSTPAGEYPSAMNRLLDYKGHVSLDPQDYSGFTQEQVEIFMASRPYEVSVVFDENGKVVGLNSEFSATQVFPAIAKSKPGYTEFHNHPENVSEGYSNFQTFSTSDVRYIATRSQEPDGPRKFAVRSWDGGRFEFEYVGGGEHKPYGLFENYSYMFRDLEYDAMGKSDRHGGAYQEEFMTSEASKWFKRNAGYFGFKYRTNWSFKPPKA